MPEFPSPQDAPIAIRGKQVGLRPVWPDDSPLIYSWWSDRDEAPLFTSQYRQITTYQQFLPWLDGWLRDSIALLKIDLATGHRFGFCRAYNMNQADGYVWIQDYTVPEYRMKLHVAEYAMLFSRYLFEHFPIRKICTEVFAYNERALQLNEKLGFQFEGRITDHTWYRDRYWDHLMYSLSRDRWHDAMERFGFINRLEHEMAAPAHEDPAIAAAINGGNTA